MQPAAGGGGGGKGGGRAHASLDTFERVRSLRSLQHFCPSDAPAAQQRALAVICFWEAIFSSLALFCL